jgi:hypothetical protein
MANNRSFETAGTVQGTADLWSATARAIQEAIAVFNAHYFGPTLISWDPAEVFERYWYMPMYVHGEDAYGSGNEGSTLYLDDIAHVDLPTREAALFRDLGYEGFERGWSVPDMATSGKLLPDGQDELIDMDSGGGGTSIWGTGIWGFTIWGSGTVSWPRWHEQFLYSWGLIRSEASVPSGEIFEKGWKLPGSYSVPTNDKFKERYYDSSVTDLVVVIGTTRIIGFATTTTKKGRISVRDASFVPDDLWKTLRIGGGPKNSGDHIIVNVLNNTDVEVLGLVVDEPAVDATAELIEYLSPWRFLQATQLQTGIVENFDSGWRDCEIGSSRYWDGTKWRFRDDTVPPLRQILSGGFATYVFADDSYPPYTRHQYPGLTSPAFSPLLWMRVTAAFAEANQFAVAFSDAAGVLRGAIFFVDADTDVDAVITKVGLTINPADPRYEFHTLFDGATLVLGDERGYDKNGSVVFEGYKDHAENFESGWTLTLTI